MNGFLTKAKFGHTRILYEDAHRKNPPYIKIENQSDSSISYGKSKIVSKSPEEARK
jgi:hypothetical protein